MTKKDNSNDKDDSAESVEKTDKKEKVAEKLEAMGVMPSEKEEVKEESTSKVFPLLMVFLIAAPVIAAVIYFQMPDQVTRLLSFDDSSEQATDSSAQPYPQYNRSLPMPAAGPQYPGQQYTAQHPSQPNPAWDNSRNTGQQATGREFPEPGMDDYMLNRSNTILVEKPQWVKDQEKEMEKQRQQLQQQLNLQQQAMLEQQQQMIKQQQAWAGMQGRPYGAGMANGNMGQTENTASAQHNSGNSASPQNTYAYSQRMQPNPYRMHPAQQQTYRQPYNLPPQAYYYNQRPFYGHHPYAAPYGWGGPVYR